jgi:peptidoglycan/xylan/chitin deacetylase (PgdA/CDA1 family)
MLAVLGSVAVLGIGGNLAWRLVPWIDPLFRIRWRLPPSLDGRPRCAVTFDDGPSPGTAEILDVLRAAGVRATFFVVARNAERYPDLVRRAAAEGHTIGIHGTTHRTLSFASAADAEREIGGAISRLVTLGVTPAPLYRAPHGRKSPATLRVLRRLGLQPWAWSRGLYDTRGPLPEQLVERAARYARPRMVLLLHDGHDDEPRPDVTPLVVALPRILYLLASRGFEFVTLDRA